MARLRFRLKDRERIPSRAVRLKQIVVLDGIERVAEPAAFRIRSHDLHGPLPEVVVSDTGDRGAILDEIAYSGRS